MSSSAVAPEASCLGRPRGDGTALATHSASASSGSNAQQGAESGRAVRSDGELRATEDSGAARQDSQINSRGDAPCSDPVDYMVEEFDAAKAIEDAHMYVDEFSEVDAVGEEPSAAGSGGAA